MPITDHASYLDHAFDSPDEIVGRARHLIGDLRFDSIVGRGLSGALVVPLIAGAFGKPFGIVRKEDECSNHSGRLFEGTIGGRWLFVDDLCSTGATLWATREAVRTRARDRRFRTSCAGAYLYAHRELWTSDAVRAQCASYERFYKSAA